MIREGAELVQLLDRAGWNPSAALWFFSSEANAWRLLLASPEVAIKGPRDAYTVVQSALGKMEASERELALEDIGVMPPDHPLIGLLRTVTVTGPIVGRIRFSRNVIDGHFIEDALIYRIT